MNFIFLYFDFDFDFFFISVDMVVLYETTVTNLINNIYVLKQRNSTILTMISNLSKILCLLD